MKIAAAVLPAQDRLAAAARAAVGQVAAVDAAAAVGAIDCQPQVTGATHGCRSFLFPKHKH